VLDVFVRNSMAERRSENFHDRYRTTEPSVRSRETCERTIPSPAARIVFRDVAASIEAAVDLLGFDFLDEAGLTFV